MQPFAKLGQRRRRSLAVLIVGMLAASSCGGGGGSGTKELSLGQPGRVGPFDVTMSDCKLINGRVWVVVELVNRSGDRQHYDKSMLEVETPAGRVSPAQGDFGEVLWSSADLQPGAKSGKGVIQFGYQGPGAYTFRVETGDGIGEMQCTPKEGRIGEP